jgi:TatD DNase family protein
MFIDSHCHINSLAEDKINNLISSGSNGYIFIDSSINVQSALLSLGLSKKYPFIYSAVGFHPFCVKEFGETTISEYEKMIINNKKIIAIGEIGLDEKAEVSLQAQEDVLRSFVMLAKRLNLPVIIHNRLKEPRIFDILDEYFPFYEKIIFHCFSYSQSFLEKIISKGGCVSFSLNILRKKKEILESLAYCPNENILLETDSPYMKIDNLPSSPLDISKVYSFAAKIRNMDAQSLKEVIFQNANKLFALS